MFKGLPGHKRIAQKDYEVTEDSEGTLIQDLDWESSILPGVRIAMSILMRTVKTAGSGLAAHTCPRFNTSNHGATPEKGSIKWYTCPNPMLNSACIY